MQQRKQITTFSEGGAVFERHDVYWDDQLKFCVTYPVDMDFKRRKIFDAIEESESAIARRWEQIAASTGKQQDFAAAKLQEALDKVASLMTLYREYVAYDWA